jgi:hypothetical protein
LRGVEVVSHSNHGSFVFCDDGNGLAAPWVFDFGADATQIEAPLRAFLGLDGEGFFEALDEGLRRRLRVGLGVGGRLQ